MNLEDLSLEAHLRDLLEYRPSSAAGSSISAEQVIRRFRRHRTRRTAIGACAATLALGVGTFTVVNQSSANIGPPTALRTTPPTPDRLSHVLDVPLEQQFTMTTGFQASLTSRGLCWQTTSAFDGLPQATPRPANCAEFAVPGSTSTASAQFTEIEGTFDGTTHQRWVTLGTYKGWTTPAQITVVAINIQTKTSSRYDATIVSNESLPGEVGFYAVLPYAEVKAITASHDPGKPPEVSTIAYTAFDANARNLGTVYYHP